MNAIRSPSTSGSDTEHAAGRAAAFLSLILLGTSLPAAAEAPKEAPAERKVAVWKVAEVGFSYRSSVAVYTCEALRDRVSSILRAIGARDDIDVKVSSCDSFEVPSIMPSQESRNGWRTPSDGFLDQRADQRAERAQLASVRVRLMMPTEVTPEILAEIDRDKSRRELISRVTGNSAATLNDPVVFPAQKQTVTLSRRTLGLEPEECELLDQISGSVFRQLKVRIVRRSFNCDRDRVSSFPPELTVESFMGVPFGSSAVPHLPEQGEADPEPSAPAASDAEPAGSATATPPPK